MGCEYCEDNRQLQVVDVYGDLAEPVGGCIVARGVLHVIAEDDTVQDRIPIQFCPMCGINLSFFRKMTV